MSVITTDDLIDHLNLPDDGSAGLLVPIIATSQATVEKLTAKALTSQSLVARFNAFGSGLVLPVAPVQSVDTITYLDDDRAEQTLVAADFFAHPTGHDDERTTIIISALNKTFPNTASIAAAVTVSYTVGYSTVPAPLIHAVKLIAGHFYENREATLVGVKAEEIPLGIMDLIANYREPVF
ncbi:MAG: head-tail connector protein [Thermoanaerobaculia bacterium]